MQLIRTNPAYTGHWVHQGVVTVWDNHDGIVEEGLFFRNFNRLSPFTLSGNVNPDFNPRAEKVHVAEDDRSQPRPVLRELIVTLVNGKQKHAQLLGNNQWMPTLTQYPNKI
jgi:hypothetical protein